MDIRSDRQKGLSHIELGKKYHMDPQTAKWYAESPERPEYTLSEPKPAKMDPFKPVVAEWLEEAPYSAKRILEKLREMGFDGGYSIVKAYVSSRKMDMNEKATVRFETMPGKQGQMDWGFFEDHVVYEDGKWKKLCFFLMILGYSRMRYVEFCYRYEHKHADTVPSERVPVLWGIPGRDTVRQHEDLLIKVKG